MGVSEERKRVLDLLASGKISVDDATSLLKALGPTPAEAYRGPSVPVPVVPDATAIVAPAAAPPPPSPAARSSRTGARVLRINIDEVSDGRSKNKVKVNVPLGLAKFALRFMPAKAKEELASQNIDINQLLDGITDQAPEGQIVELESVKNDGSGTIERITIEVI